MKSSSVCAFRISAARLRPPPPPSAPVPKSARFSPDASALFCPRLLGASAEAPGRFRMSGALASSFSPSQPQLFPQRGDSAEQHFLVGRRTQLPFSGRLGKEQKRASFGQVTCSNRPSGASRTSLAPSNVELLPASLAEKFGELTLAVTVHRLLLRLVTRRTLAYV